MIPNQPMRIGLARSADAERLASMSRTLIEAGLFWRWTPQRIKDCIHDTNSIVIVARNDISLVGFAAMRFGATQAHLLLLAVSPPYQRRGLGDKMLRWLEKSARVAGITKLLLEVRADNSAAQAFYRAQGYRIECLLPGYYSGRKNALRMSKQLDATVT